MSIKRVIAVIVASFLLSGVIVACSDAPSTPLRVGLNYWPGYAPLFIAAEKGYFAEEGVEVELVEMTSLWDIRKAFERGQLDGMATSLVEAIEVSHDSKQRAVISLVTDYSNGADLILAEESFPSMASLSGRRIGIEPGTLNRVILARALDRHGLSEDDVEIVNLQNQLMATAISSGVVDALVTYPPLSTEVERQGGVVRVFSTAEIPGEIADVVSFDVESATYRRAEIEAFGRAWTRAVTFMAEHPEEAHKLMSRHIGMTPAEVKASYQGIQIVGADMQADFFEPTGPLVEGIEALSAILWPDEEDVSDDMRPAFFVSLDNDDARLGVWK